MNFDIRFDFQRRDRLGLIEAIWGQDKSIDQLKRLSENVLSKNEVVFITRIKSEKAIALLEIYDDARFYEEAGCLIIGENLKKLNTDKKVAIIGTGATAVQCVPHLGETAEKLYVFQRTPSSIDVRNNQPTDSVG